MKRTGTFELHLVYNTNGLYWLKKPPTPNVNINNNRFSILATNEDDCTVTSPKKSPPIFVQNVEYIVNLTAVTNIPDIN